MSTSSDPAVPHDPEDRRERHDDPPRNDLPERDPSREDTIRDPDAPGQGLEVTDAPIPEPNEPA
ncbi:MAG: hypothetical protein KDB40_04090 [Acidimicrobiales bacterium]|nr:hypothetical protein [Acidimicrobiales bacterium]MCB9393562.1 hypothetical protein [Acidimicrobiaceae bacterium]